MLVSLLVCLIPTTIGALVSAIGVAGMDRLVQRNVLAMSGRAVEAAGDVSTLLLDKTGTITFGNRQAAELITAPGVAMSDLATAALKASMADETPEGKSLVELCETTYGVTDTAVPAGGGADRILGPDPDERRRPARRRRRSRSASARVPQPRSPPGRSSTAAQVPTRG